jgi:hypothetical protein
VGRRSECVRRGEVHCCVCKVYTHSHQHFMRWGRFRFPLTGNGFLVTLPSGFVFTESLDPFFFFFFFLKSWHSCSSTIDTLQAGSWLCLFAWSERHARDYFKMGRPE